MNQLGYRIYRLDGVEIDTSRLCLKRDGEEQHVRQKTFQVLVYLLENRERLVTKAELIDNIWTDTAVTENTLEQCLAEIRKLLRDNSRQPRFIKTVPRAGYRFIAEVEETESTKSTPAVTQPIAKESRERDLSGASQAKSAAPFVTNPGVIVVASLLIALAAIAVLYLMRQRPAHQSFVSTTIGQDPTKRPIAVMFFDNESRSSDLDWLREGLADMIITDLSRSKNLVVLSRPQLHVLLERIVHKPSEQISLDEALNIGRLTQAKVLVLGSFAKLGGQIRIDVHLHDARDGQLLTAERLVVDEPEQILTQVDLLSFKLRTYLGAASQAEANSGAASVMTNNLEAFRYYSLGVEKANLLRSEEAQALFEKAIALDPNFAMAHARIGYAIGVIGNQPDRAKPYLQKAFQFSDRLTEKDRLQIQAWYAIVNFDYATAIEAFRRLVSAHPLEIEAYRRLAALMKGEERFPEAIEVLKQALVIDSGAKDLYNGLGSLYSQQGRHDEAIAMFQRYVQLAPDEPNSHDSLGLGYQWAGRFEEAIQEYERSLSLKPDFEIAIVHLANLYFHQGRYRAAIEQYTRYIRVAPSNSERARGHFGLGYIELRRGNLKQAERAAAQALKHDEALDLPYLLALNKDDLSTAARLKAEIEKRSRFERGARGSLRPLWFFRGMYFLKSSAAEEAIQDFKQAIGQRPETWNVDAFEDCLANAYLQLGRLDEAIAEYQRIERLNPNYPLVHYHLAQAYQRKGQHDRARVEYTRFLEVWKAADADIPEVVSARKALASRAATATRSPNIAITSSLPPQLRNARAPGTASRLSIGKNRSSVKQSAPQGRLSGTTKATFTHSCY